MEADSSIDRPALVKSFQNRFKGKERQSRGDIYSRIKTMSTSIPEEHTVEDLVDAMKKLWAMLEDGRVGQVVSDVMNRCLVRA